MNRRKYIFRLGAALAALVLMSCNDQLDLQSDGRISKDGIFANRNNVRGYLNSIYTYGPTLNLEHSNYTDECEPASMNSGGASQYDYWYRGAVSPTTYSQYSKDGDPWGLYYEGIRKCNIFLAGIDGYQGLSFGNEVSSWEAQARLLRAFYYLQLIKRYGSVPYVTEELTVDQHPGAVVRSTFGQVARHIIDECRLALEAPDDNTENSFSWTIYANQFGIMHRAVAYALMSEAALYAASPLYADGTISWQEAASITGEALFQCLTHDYRLFDITPSDNVAHDAYAYYFLVGSDDRRSVDKETIYQYSGDYPVWQSAGLPSTQGQVSAGPCPTQNLVDCYEMQGSGHIPILGYSDPDKLVPVRNPLATDYDEQNPYAGRDPRFYGSIYYNGAPRYLNNPAGTRVETMVGGREGISSSDQRHTRTGYYVRKMSDYRSGENGEYDGRMRSYRLAGLYLNFAEAAYNATGSGYEGIEIGRGMILSAAEAVNTVRARANMPPLPNGLSVGDFETRYRNERRIELAFEGHRYYDVRRWKIMDSTDGKITGMRITQNPDLSYGYQRFLVNDRQCTDDKFLLYALNEEEVRRMKMLTGGDWQNPGW